MKIIEIGGHNEMCGGYSYDYEITFGKYGNTLKDVLKEIKEYSYEHSFGRLGDFGNPETAIEGKYWGIYVNNKIYISGWAGENKNNAKRSLWKTFYEGDESEVVASIRGDGGWYCGINIYITTNPKPYKYTDDDFELDMPLSKRIISRPTGINIFDLMNEEQREHDMLYEPTYNLDDGSM